MFVPLFTKLWNPVPMAHRRQQPCPCSRNYQWLSHASCGSILHGKVELWFGNSRQNLAAPELSTVIKPADTRAPKQRPDPMAAEGREPRLRAAGLGRQCHHPGHVLSAQEGLGLGGIHPRRSPGANVNPLRKCLHLPNCPSAVGSSFLRVESNKCIKISQELSVSK